MYKYTEADMTFVGIVSADGDGALLFGVRTNSPTVHLSHTLALQCPSEVDTVIKYNRFRP